MVVLPEILVLFRIVLVILAFFLYVFFVVVVVLGLGLCVFPYEVKDCFLNFC